MKTTKQKESFRKEIAEFLEERALMRRAGFPYCFVENFVEYHCDSCIKFYRQRKETHKPMGEVNVLNE